MVNGTCAVVSFTNNKYKLKKWRKKECMVHAGMINENCPCDPPFQLHSFPSKLRFGELRKTWIRALNRVTKKHTPWQPGSSDMVCSEHFEGGKPTAENPVPTLKLGYEKPAKSVRRQLVRHELTPAAEAAKGGESGKDDEGRMDHAFGHDHAYLSLNSEACGTCKDKNNLINSYREKLKKLSEEKKHLQAQVTKMKEEIKANSVTNSRQKPFSVKYIKKDADMKFYTGFQSVKVFNAVFELLKPYTAGLKYWRGEKHVLSHKIKGKLPTKTMKVAGRDQFLLVLMRLRLGLLTQDLAQRFNISVGTCSTIFSTWIRFLSSTFADALLTWLPRDVITSNLPEMFKKSHRKTRCIIDCSEIFIERPKTLEVQAATWSDYKKHNTVKFLIAISPTGYIMFLSDCYGGRTSDQYICQNSTFYNKLEYGDEIMADRGFQIKEDLLHHYCTLSIPPGARAKSQMTANECKTTKEVANLRIHVERAINRLKTFRILKNILPLTLLPYVDDIVHTCAALCNIQPPLIRPTTSKV